MCCFVKSQKMFLGPSAKSGKSQSGSAFGRGPSPVWPKSLDFRSQIMEVTHVSSQIAGSNTDIVFANNFPWARHTEITTCYLD